MTAITEHSEAPRQADDGISDDEKACPVDSREVRPLKRAARPPSRKPSAAQLDHIAALP
jgi:hypothetical protein